MGFGELPVEAYEVFSDTDLPGDLALQRMMAKLSTRRYQSGLEPVGGRPRHQHRRHQTPARAGRR